MFKFVLKIAPVAMVMWAINAQATVNMAVIAPRVGELKSFGDELVNGVKIAVDDLNAAGGIRGERINLVIVDDQCEDKFAVSTAQMMAVNSSAADKMNLVIGPYCPNEFAKVSDIYAKANIFQIIPTTVGKDEAVHNHQGLVKMVGSTEAQGKDFYNYYRHNFAGQGVALVYDGDIRNVVEIAAAVQNQFRTHNQNELLKTYNSAHYGKSPAGLARDVVGQGSQVVYILGEAEEIALLARDVKDEDRNMVIFTNRYQARENYQEMLGDLAEGSYSVALPSLKNSPDFTETLVRLRLQGQEPEGLGVYSYSAVKLWQEAVGKAGSFKYQDLAQAVNKHRFDTAWGEQMYTNGNPATPINYGIYRLQGGEYTQVY